MTPEEFRESAARAIEARIDDIKNDGGKEGLVQAAAIVRAHPVASPWIPVGERLPEYDPPNFAKVLAVDDDGLVGLAHYGGSQDDPIWIRQDDILSEPILWMPIPPTESAS